MNCKVIVCLLVCFVSVISAVTYTSHTKYVQETEVFYTNVCSYYQCGYSCWNWGWWGWWWWWWSWNCGYRSTCHTCYVDKRTRQVQKLRCADFWTGPDCNIPHCSRKCPTGEACVPGDKCQCLTVGGTKCTAVGCTSPKRSCYPGTCAGSSCSCPPQFNGTNCERILQTPDISECQVKLFSGNPEVEVASAHCAVEGHSPEITWVAKGSFSRIEAGWETKYLYPYDPVPPAETSHIKDAKFGVTNTKATVTVVRPSSSPINKDITPVCKVQPSSPESYVDCKRRSILWTEFGLTSIPVNSTLEVVVSSRLGGYKTLHEGNKKEDLTGLQTSERKALFKVDTIRPSHCRQSGNCSDPAISVALDAVKNPVVEFEFPSWFDRESGIKSYDVEIYELLKSSSSGETILVRSQNPKDKRSGSGDINKWQYTFPSPGVYSVELTVSDNANNPSKARKIILYDKESHMKITQEQLFKIAQASNESGYRWITDRSKLRDGGDGLSRLTLSWVGRYSNPKHINEGWLSRVEPWNVDGGIDDNSKSGGSRTIHKIENSNGTAYCKLAFKVDKQGGSDLRPKDFEENFNLTETDDLPESTWMVMPPSVTTKVIVMPALTPNDTVVIWMRAYDAVGYYSEDLVLVRYDTTEPKLDSDRPAVLQENTPDAHHSRIVINVKDLESGIAEVRYHIRDASLNVDVTSGTAKARMLKRSGEARRRRTSAVCNPRTDSSCYCINGGECFENEVVITIDHCTIDKYYSDERTMSFNYTVFNQAGKFVGPREPLVLKFAGGKPNCRPVTIFTAGTVLAIVVGLLILIVLVVLVVFMILRWKQNKHPIPTGVRSLATSMRQRITNKEQVLDSEGHVIFRSKTRHGRQTMEEDEDIYVDGSDPGGWRITRDQVELAETLAEGRFAIVKKAYLNKGGERKVVAVKFLPSGASDSDRALLKAKIAFHGNRVPPHDNIVRLIGVLDDGPAMLLEFCDVTLKDWLSKVGKVDTDALENMLNFTLHIASGMDHLHSKGIVHSRLAMRNILLKSDGMNGLVAKLIGFGSFNDAGSDDGAAEATTTNVAVPLKWLAPETLESVGKGKAVYTQKSDIWAYGVAIWEIYSLGATPYSGKKSAEVEALLKTGFRMQKPDECPPELFDSVVTPCWIVTPKKRPDFKAICKQIRAFRSGGDTQECYYAVDAKSKTYDNPKERTTEYISAGKRAPDNDYQVQEELYDDTRHH